MAETGLVAIGTRGTVGSLLRREMEYYSQPQMSSNHGRNKTLVDQNQIVDMSSRRAFPGIIFGFRRYRSWRKKKLLVPGIFSVAGRDRRSQDKVPGFSYMILRDEYKNMNM